MSTVRRIRRVIRSKPTAEGAGVHLMRALGFAEVPAMDAFVLLDGLRSCGPGTYVKGFPWLPHRGIERQDAGKPIGVIVRGTREREAPCRRAG